MGNKVSIVHALIKNMDTYFYRLMWVIRSQLFMLLTLSQTSPGLQYKSLENTVGKGEIARNKQFILFLQCFLPVLKTFCRFHQS